MYNCTITVHIHIIIFILVSSLKDVTSVSVRYRLKNGGVTLHGEIYQVLKYVFKLFGNILEIKILKLLLGNRLYGIWGAVIFLFDITTWGH